MRGWRRRAAWALTVGRSLAHDLETALAQAPVPPACQARVRPALAHAVRAIAAPGQPVAVRIFLAGEGAEATAGWGFFLVERTRRAAPVIELFIYPDGAAGRPDPEE
jgi:hypothetical protein